MPTFDQSVTSRIAVGQALGEPSEGVAGGIDPGSVDPEALAADPAFTGTFVSMVTGLPGDGTTDVQATIQAAITAAGDDGEVVIPEGRHYLATPLSVSGLDRLTIRGRGWGTVLVTDADDQVLDLFNCTGLTIADMTVEGDGNAAKTQQRGIQAVLVSDSTFRNVRAYNLGYDGIELLQACVDNTVIGCWAESCGDDGINIGGAAHATDTTGNQVIGCHAIDNGAKGIHLSTDSLGSIVIGCHTSGNGSGGIDTITGSTGNLISNNVCPDGITLDSDNNFGVGNIADLTDNGASNQVECSPTAGRVYQRAVPPFATGRWAIGGRGASNAVRGTSSSTMYLVPVRVRKGKALDMVGFEQTTAGGAGTVARLGVYLPDVNGMPGTLLQDAGTVALDGANGNKELALACTPTTDFVFVAIAAQSHSGSPVVRAQTDTDDMILPATFPGTTPHGCYFQFSVSGALPATPTISGSTSNAPLVGVRYD
jgi:hypothetical protein